MCREELPLPRLSGRATDHSLVGRKPTLSEVQEIVVALIKEIRRGQEPLVDIIPWEDYIGVDLEV